MNTITSRLLVLALAGALTCSLTLGAVAPVAAGGVLVGDGPSLEGGVVGATVDDGVDDAAGEAGDVGGVDGANASHNGTVANGTNGSAMQNGTNGSAMRNGTTPTPTSTPDDTATDETATDETATDETATDETNDTGVVGDVAETVDAVENGTSVTVDETADATVDTVDETANGTGETVTETANATGETVTKTVNGTAGTVNETTNATGETVENATGDVTGTGGGEEGSGTAEAHGWPTAGGELTEEHRGHLADYGAGGPTAERMDLEEQTVGQGADGSETDADGGDGAAGDGSPPRGPFDPGAGGAAVGAALVVGSLVATRTGMAASTTGAGATGLLQALFAALRWFLFRVAVLAGYSRYDFEDPLENENRATVQEAVESSPGINLTSLVESTGLAESTVRYHLRVLEHEGLLEGTKVRGRRRYVPRTDDDVELLAAFEEEATKDVLAALFEHEPATGTTLAEALDRDPSTVSHHLSRLSEAGLLDREQDGPALQNSLAPEVRRAFSDVEVTASVQGHAQADD